MGVQCTRPTVLNGHFEWPVFYELGGVFVGKYPMDCVYYQRENFVSNGYCTVEQYPTWHQQSEDSLRILVAVQMRPFSPLSLIATRNTRT